MKLSMQILSIVMIGATFSCWNHTLAFECAKILQSLDQSETTRESASREQNQEPNNLHNQQRPAHTIQPPAEFARSFEAIDRINALLQKQAAKNQTNIPVHTIQQSVVADPHALIPPRSQSAVQEPIEPNRLVPPALPNPQNQHVPTEDLNRSPRNRDEQPRPHAQQNPPVLPNPMQRNDIDREEQGKGGSLLGALTHLTVGAVVGYGAIKIYKYLRDDTDTHKVKYWQRRFDAFRKNLSLQDPHDATINEALAKARETDPFKLLLNAVFMDSLRSEDKERLLTVLRIYEEEFVEEFRDTFLQSLSEAQAHRLFFNRRPFPQEFLDQVHLLILKRDDALTRFDCTQAQLDSIEKGLITIDSLRRDFDYWRAITNEQIKQEWKPKDE